MHLIANESLPNKNDNSAENYHFYTENGFKKGMLLSKKFVINFQQIVSFYAKSYDQWSASTC